MSSQMNDAKSLTDIVKENTSLFSAIGVFAAIGGFFLTKIDTNYSTQISIAWANNLLYLIISNFSYLSVIILSFEFFKNLPSIKTLNFESVMFVISIRMIVISINFLYIISDVDIFIKIFM